MKSIQLLGRLSLLALAGCVTQPWEGVWWIEIPLGDVPECTTTVTENYNDAQAPDDPIVDPGGFVITVDGVGSPGGQYVYIHQARGGNVFMDAGGAVYTGTVEAGTVTVDWQDSWNGSVTETYEAEYAFEEVADRNNITTFEFTRNADTKGLTGTIRQDSAESIAWRESDRWDPKTVGLFGSQIASTYYLEGKGSINSSVEADCQGPDCELAVETVCEASAPFEGLYAGTGDEGLFDALEDYGRAPGSPF